MIRDPGPIQNLGYGVTSRDLPINEGESEGTASNSGMISRALNGHPIMKFFASTATVMVASGVASKVTKRGGLKLAKFLQTSSDNGKPLATKMVKSAVEIRRHLDELQGVSRYVEGESDVYSKLVYERQGQLTTGYDGIVSERHGYQYLTKEEKNLAGSNFLGNEPPAVWQYRDELQQRLVRAGRRMPYELPAMYGAQKAIVDPIFGEREEGQRKIKWYNPADVIADFTKSSLTMMATMIAPFEGAGAALGAGKSSLNTLRYSMNDMRNLTPFNKKLRQGFVDVTETLADVGHDFATMTNKFLKSSAQTSGALSTATKAYTQNQQGFVQNLQSLRHGVKAARDAEIAQGASRQAINKAGANAFFKGFKDASGETSASITELPSAFRGLRKAFVAGKEEYKNLGRGYDALENSIAHARVLKSMGGTPQAAQTLESAMHKIQSQHSSRLSSFARGVRIMGGGGPGNESLPRSNFAYNQQTDAFKDLLQDQLISRGLDGKQAKQFTDYLKVRLPKSNMESTNIITIGKTKIYEEGADAASLSEDFFSKVIQRYKGVSGGKTFEDAIQPNALKNSVEDARDIFASKEFQKGLNNKIAKNWNKFYRDDLTTIGGGILKPMKANYNDFTGPHTAAKTEFLQRKTAQTLGINLTDSTGRQVSNDIVTAGLRKRGFDPNQFTDLRAFLIKNRQMTSGVSGGGHNLFGLKSLTIDEARQSGRFSHMSEPEQKIIHDLASRMAINDPVSKSIGFSKMDGVYQSRSGQILDFTSVKSTFSKTANFFASEFKIPILGFNPADLFGYRSFSEMANRSPLQYVSSRSVQPFMPEGASTKSDFHMWFKTKGSKGKLMAFDTDNVSETIHSSLMSGTYRALPTNTTDLLTRHTRFAANMQGQTINEIRDSSGSKFLDRILGGERALRFKKKMSIDPEQPNSLFGLASRFKNRSTDLSNNGVMARLLSGDDLKYNSGGKERLIKIDKQTSGGLRVVDDLGNVVDDFSEADLLKGMHSLSKESLRYGTPVKVMKELETLNPGLFTFGGRTASSIETAEDAVKFADDLLAAQKLVSQQLRRQGVDPTMLNASSSRIRNLKDSTNLNAMSQMAEKSPTITTKLDQLKNEIFRYISQSNQMQAGSSGNIFIEMQTVVDKLIKSGAISSSERVEAQAAALSTMFNMSAFKTFKHSAGNLENARAGAVEMFELSRSNNGSLKSMFDPFAKSEMSKISTGIRKKFSPLVSLKQKALGTSGYQADDLAVDPLGSGQSITVVPTFGTVFGRDPMGAIKSAIGLTTYSDPQSFSTASIPVSQGVERLNRYFGTLGMQLNVSDFKGPLDLFATGMVGKRVLPMYAAGVTALTVDRTMGGMVNEKDDRGERVYSPLVLGQVAKGAMELQSLSAGLTPGGMTYDEKKEQLVEGEVPIRQGRFWPLGNTPFKGGKIQYYRPSWYRKLQAGAMFTSDTYGSPAEKFLFYNDISPLRPLDPYRFERKHYEDRPYPVSGEYFTGPFGPLVPLANMTVGKLLKPQVLMHEDETARGLSNYTNAGQSGAYDASAYGMTPSYVDGVGFTRDMAGGPPGMPLTGSGAMTARPGSPIGSSGATGISGVNSMLASRAGSTGAAGSMVRSSLKDVNSQYSDLAYGPPKTSGVMAPRIVGAGAPLEPSTSSFQAGELGFRMQEMAGIYGFGFGNLRKSLGFGQQDYQPQRSVLQSASKAYGSTRAFWDLNLGGLGDAPLGNREGLGNLEFSEIVRRFIPKERTGVDYINPIENTMGKQYPFLPGSEYFTDFTRGDPYTKVQEGELRLPGVGYERFNRLNPDSTGSYGALDQLKILGDVAPFSQQYKTLDKKIDSMDLGPAERNKVADIRSQVESMATKNEFTDYKYKGSSAEEMGQHPLKFGAGRIGEYIAHSDNFAINKTIGKRTATEDWERKHVYGATFPEWQRPYDSYIKPMIDKSTQRDPITAATGLGIAGSLFGRTAKAKLLGTAVGVTTGLAASTYGQASELITGERFIPKQRKKELALEEYSDILNYVKNKRLETMAKSSGDEKAALDYGMAAKRTMYGADLYGKDIDTLSLSIPKRKREHFKAMLNAPEGERGRILSTAGRLERRIYEASWGMNVEQRPDLDDYFTRHELPDASWEGWHPNTNLEQVKIKTGESMGIEMSQMGYFPQQIREANLANPSYPQFGKSSDGNSTLDKLRQLMNGFGFSGSVTPVMNPFGSQGIDVSAGVR